MTSWLRGDTPHGRGGPWSSGGATTVGLSSCWPPLRQECSATRRRTRRAANRQRSVGAPSAVGVGRAIATRQWRPCPPPGRRPGTGEEGRGWAHAHGPWPHAHPDCAAPADAGMLAARGGRTVPVEPPAAAGACGCGRIALAAAGPGDRASWIAPSPSVPGRGRRPGVVTDRLTHETVGTTTRRNRGSLAAAVADRRRVRDRQRSSGRVDPRLSGDRQPAAEDRQAEDSRFARAIGVLGCHQPIATSSNRLARDIDGRRSLRPTTRGRVLAGISSAAGTV